MQHADDVARGLLAGADVTVMTSELIDQGPLHVGMVEADLTTWVSEMGYASVAELTGSVSMRTVADPSAFERANYIETLVNYTNSFHDGWASTVLTGPRVPHRDRRQCAADGPAPAAGPPVRPGCQSRRTGMRVRSARSRSIGSRTVRIPSV